MSKYSEMIRISFKKNDDIRDAGLTTPEDIVRYDDIAYGPDPRQQSLDVYRPREAEGEKLPVIVSVHGGGWVYGDKERYQYYCMNLAQRGFAVVNFTYRLAPENKYPASLEDTNSVFTWVLANGEQYGFDLEHIFAVGDSAGAHNLAMYSSICTNPEYAAQFEFKTPKGFVPTAVGLNCGAYHVTMDLKKNEQQTRLIMDFMPENYTEEQLDLLAAEKYVTSKFPPTFLMTSTGDFLKEQAPLMVKKLTECDVPFVYRYYGDAEHQLPHVFHCNIRSEFATLCNDEECDFFKRVYKLK